MRRLSLLTELLRFSGFPDAFPVIVVPNLLRLNFKIGFLVFCFMLDMIEDIAANDLVELDAFALDDAGKMEREQHGELSSFAVPMPSVFIFIFEMFVDSPGLVLVILFSGMCAALEMTIIG